MGKEAEALIQAILRSYTGVFTDYAYISEESLAVRTGLTRQQIYAILVTLTKRRIVDYIPHKKTPYIIYTRERMELHDVHIPTSVYEDRKVRYEARIKAMEEYVTTDNICRSRMLLRYFGEKNEHNCKQCDVCLSHHADSHLSETSFEELKRQILFILNKRNLLLRISLTKWKQKRRYRRSHSVFIRRRSIEDRRWNDLYFKISYYICT